MYIIHATRMNILSYGYTYTLSVHRAINLHRITVNQVSNETNEV